MTATLDLTSTRGLDTMTPAQVDMILVNAIDMINRSFQRVLGQRSILSCEPRQYQNQESANREHQDRLLSYNAYYHRNLLSNYYNVCAEHDAVEAKWAPIKKACDAEYDRRGGWTRYIVVPGGHFHKHRGCGSIRWTTSTVWTPEHSGLTEDEIVAKLDERACTKCFPNAPVAPRGPVLRDGDCELSGQKFEGTTDIRGREFGTVWDSSYQRVFVRCPSCGKRVRLNKGNVIRKHKK